MENTCIPVDLSLIHICYSGYVTEVMKKFVPDDEKSVYDKCVRLDTIRKELQEKDRYSFSCLLYTSSRIQGMNFREAALEVNYCCAEEATYHCTDDRTLSAISVYRRGNGRCGEESVFTVNALRSVGVPARQVYAPKWSHSFWLWYYHDVVAKGILR